MSTSPDSSRRYGWIDGDIREIAVNTVRELLPTSRSLWSACREVSAQLDVHPNTVKNWYQAAHRDGNASSTALTSQELAAVHDRLRAYQKLNTELLAALRDRDDLGGRIDRR